jgi:hypothetical protein
MMNRRPTAWPDITANFLAHNGLSLVVRSHEVKDEGEFFLLCVLYRPVCLHCLLSC